MRKIIVGAQVSMDDVMQAPGGPTDDPTKGFKFGGWVMPYFDQEFGEELDRLYTNGIELDARIVTGVCDNQFAAARKLLILKTERCPSG